MVGSFIASGAAMVAWLNGAPGEWGYDIAPINLRFNWLPVGETGSNGWLTLGLYVDSLSIVMFCMVTLVASLVHLFSIGYMRNDPLYHRFFCYLGLFGFSMLGLVIGGTLLQLFVFWELVGLCSYLLIGFWYEKKSASNAAIKAFVTNRVGDFFFLIGLGILFVYIGNVALPDLWALLGAASTGNDVLLPDGRFPAAMLTLMGIGLFFGAVGKSAQFPLHTWLPDAMEGPTPVSALIHAATMVAAGVYLVGRIYPILTPDARLFIAIIGCITLSLGAFIAIAQTDIKKVLAYSTISQLGYMMLAMGVGSWIGALFHLITHAFFKALLFLGSGSVIDAAHHEQDLRQYGGLWRKIPVTAATFGIGVLTIAGTPFLSGYFSKDMILMHAGALATLATDQGQSRAWWLLFVIPGIVAFLTPFYMTRCWMLTFAGRPRNHHVHEHARERAAMYNPLVVLALLSIVAGYAWFPVLTMIETGLRESRTIALSLAPAADTPAVDGFATVWPTHAPAHGPEAAVDPVEPVVRTPAVELLGRDAALAHGYELVHRWITWAFLVGIALGVGLYWRGPELAGRISGLPVLRHLRTAMLNRLYFDELYDALFVAPALALAAAGKAVDRLIDFIVDSVAGVTRLTAVLIGLHDRFIVDGAVNGAAGLSQAIGALVRLPQSGRIRLYMTVVMLAITLGVAAAVALVALR
jgi:NADH-quinone oxidoreductase subunit L